MDMYGRETGAGAGYEPEGIDAQVSDALSGILRH
jgi:hypothetical protein